MGKRARNLVVGSALAATLALTACGGGDATGEPADSAVSDEPIKIMVTETLSSPTMSFAQSAAGAQAAAAEINAAGGVDGRKIEVIECNDEFNPNKAAACVQAGADEGVVAFVGALNMFTPQLWPAIEGAGIPFLALSGNSPDQTQNPLSYPLTSGLAGLHLAAGRIAVEEGGERVAIIKPDNAQADYVGDFAERGVEAAGGEVAGTVRIDLGAPDMSAAAAQVVALGADGAVCACNPGDAPRILKSLRQQGYEGVFATSNSNFYPADIEELGPLADNLYTVANIRPPSDPEAGEWVSALTEHDPEAKQDSVSAATWLAVHIIADLVTGMDSPTGAKLIEALDSAGSLDTRGLTGDTVLTFTKPGPLEGAERLTGMGVMTFVTKDGVREEFSDGFVDATK
ncbi:ABC transporter substrate-binding protein [Microbacterium sp. zg-YB36]|uniref:ABC transporter substrate-binding protein n=1 Tax=Microbacterium sp. zg-YB36 TaxID=2969407 RepID=UPI00214B2109|nr:ABC transporter substrate-binding protein [Microbacterium sp. zg-YB36]MDL5352125.1 ABC transporter substrate-binding protein [Microbacterium sp. zg-YB36]